MSPFLRYSVSPCERPLVSPSPPSSVPPLSPSAATPPRARRRPVPPRTGARRRRAARAAARARWRGRGRCRCGADAQDRTDSRRRSTASTVPRDAAMRIVPPSSTCAMPCVTAFSTIGCSRSGGTRQPSAPSDAISTWSRLPKRTCSISRNRPASASSRATRDAIARAEREAVAKEVGEQQAHPAGRRRIRRRQRADRVQAVEQEVRIDLRAQRSQLRFTRQHLHLQPPALGLARLLERSEQVAHRERQQIQQQAEPEDQRGRRARRRRPRRGRRGVRRAPIQPRASASQAPLLSDRRGQRPSSRCGSRRSPTSGMLRATYHADRQKNA